MTNIRQLKPDADVFEKCLKGIRVVLKDLDTLRARRGPPGPHHSGCEEAATELYNYISEWKRDTDQNST